jgi:hypothetical protein
MIAVAIILGLVGTAIIFAAGYIASSGGRGSSGLDLSVAAGGAGTPCELLCRTWNSRRAGACSAMAASAMAASALAAANAQLFGALTTAGVLLAAALAAQSFPLLGLVVASSLFAAYAVAQFAVIYLAGAAAGAANVAADAAGQVTRALAEVAKAEAALKEGCTDPTALAACLATPSPCAGVP